MNVGDKFRFANSFRINYRISQAENISRCEFQKWHHLSARTWAINQSGRSSRRVSWHTRTLKSSHARIKFTPIISIELICQVVDWYLHVVGFSSHQTNIQFQIVAKCKTRAVKQIIRIKHTFSWNEKEEKKRTFFQDFFFPVWHISFASTYCVIKSGKLLNPFDIYMKGWIMHKFYPNITLANRWQR